MLFRCVNRLIDVKQNVVLPCHNSSMELAENFRSYFMVKVNNIRKTFPSSISSCRKSLTLEDKFTIYTFELTTENEIRLVIKTYVINTSTVDPIPIQLLKNNVDLFISLWTDLVNLSLSQGSMDCLKNAILNPLFKDLDNLMGADLVKNYKPVPNLVFLSKLTERIVAIRLEDHTNKHKLHSRKQYGYKKGHSAEMLLVKVVNDLLIACDKKTATVLLLLDLSAAFDTVDQNKLLKILYDEIGIHGIAFSWFGSFPLNRTQQVKIGNSYSSENILQFGVPQGSVLGPILFNIYIRSFYRQVSTLSFEVEGFADDYQLLKQFNAIFQVKALGEDTEQCFQVIESWMNEFFLRLNPSKTNILVVCPPSVNVNISINGTFINRKCIRFAKSAKLLGIIFDTDMSFDKQIKKLSTSCFKTIRDISLIKAFLTLDQLKTLVSTLVFSKLDYCNALYYGINLN